MAHIAKESQLKSFESAHEDIKRTLLLGSEILWLTREECVSAGPNIDETLELTEVFIK